jgi:DNA-binding NarL/FixJ family response regulator
MKTKPPMLVLTPRERDLVRCIVAGKTNREIAQALRLSEQAVKNVLSTIYLKCHVRNRLELALFAVRHHLLADEDVHREKKIRTRT